MVYKSVLQIRKECAANKEVVLQVLQIRKIFLLQISAPYKFTRLRQAYVEI